METKKNILIAPLNWGLGHATRCIPIIKELTDNGYNPIIASDGVALDLLRKEFPDLTSIQIPSYQIKYAKKGKYFKLKLILNLHKIIGAIFLENIATAKICKKHNIEGIISDNRLGVYNRRIPSVFITHQLKVLTGNTTSFTTKMHSLFIKKFKECWVPDFEKHPNLSGDLGHLKHTDLNVKYIGPLSRLEKKDLPIKYDLMVILSGPEPQRTMLEDQLFEELKSYKGSILFIKGKIEDQQTIEQQDNFTIYNFMKSEELEIAFNESNHVLCRSGYTTVMDLAKLQKKAFFIPTPGQYEQEYLAQKFMKESIAPCRSQNHFKVAKLEEIDLYKGFNLLDRDHVNWKNLFLVFQN